MIGFLIILIGIVLWILLSRIEKLELKIKHDLEPIICQLSEELNKKK